MKVTPEQLNDVSGQVSAGAGDIASLLGISQLLGEAGNLYATTEEQIASSMRG
jgi:hypothetical protein